MWVFFFFLETEVVILPSAVTDCLTELSEINTHCEVQPKCEHFMLI